MENNEALSTYWWKENDKVHETIFSIVRFLDQNQGWIQQQNLRAMRLYGNLNVLGMTSHTYSQSNAVNQPYDRLTLNVVQNMCDTVTNKIAKNKPKPTFVTSGGDYSLQKKAKQLEKFVGGQFYATEFYEKSQRAFLDATIFGTGILKIYRNESEICVERIFPDEIQVDQAESLYGEQRSLYQRKFVPKEVLVGIYPAFRSEIMTAKRAEHTTPSHQNLSNNVMVTEAWHLANKEGKGGRHVICIENATMVDEDYTKDYFPFVFFRWSQRPLGFFGQGLAEQLTGVQVEINKILRTIQLSLHLLGAPAVAIESGSKIVKSHMNNEVGRIITYSGTPPQIWAQNPLAPQMFEHLDRLYMRAYEVAGISQMAAQSQKPAGLNSGKALREFNDIESERFITVGQCYEKFHMDAAKQMITLAKEIFEDEGEYTVKIKGRKFLEKIDWSEVDLEEDEYMMHVFPTSFLSQTPAGRLADVQELIQAGFIDQANALKLLDMPDLENYMSIKNAAIEDIQNNIELMIDKGVYLSPEPEQDLQMAIPMVQSAYLRAKNDNVVEERLELLRRWIAFAREMLKAAEAAVAPAPAPMEAPIAEPIAPPVSDIMPINPTA